MKWIQYNTSIELLNFNRTLVFYWNGYARLNVMAIIKESKYCTICMNTAQKLPIRNLKLYDVFRFGKRSDSSQSDSDQRFVMLQGADDSASRLSRPR